MLKGKVVDLSMKSPRLCRFGAHRVGLSFLPETHAQLSELRPRDVVNRAIHWFYDCFQGVEQLMLHDQAGFNEDVLMKKCVRTSQRGFTLVEIMIAVAIIGLLAAIAIPNFQRARVRSQYSKIGNDFRVFGQAFQQYAMETGDYPPDSHITLPPGMDQYIKSGQWLDARPLGGTYNWEGPNSYPYAGISIYQPNATDAQFAELDAMIDDGDTSTGEFRQTPNGRYTYIVE